ncbi:MAG: DNA-binding response regulator, partial [Chrysiogenetes bacterium]|nr:DNA-binding response regulator [Chrysiogenetes bacterium]
MQNKALIAEPNQRLAQRIGKELEAIGLAVDYVRDGASALKQLSAGGYRLLLTNLILPQLSGAELVRRL